jgi:hypothetical protein
LTITPAPDPPDAWKKEPYYFTIKGWARKFCPENRKVLVKDRHGSVTAVLPDREVQLGVVGADHEVVISGDGSAYSATTRPKMKFAKPAAEYG